MDSPVTSVGMRSAVNWMREADRSRQRARLRARVVLPTPGTSSMRRCPPARKVAMVALTAFGLPTTTVSMRERKVSTSARRASGPKEAGLMSTSCRTATLPFSPRSVALRAEIGPLPHRNRSHSAPRSVRFRREIGRTPCRDRSSSAPRSVPRTDLDDARPGRGLSSTRPGLWPVDQLLSRLPAPAGHRLTQAHSHSTGESTAARPASSRATGTRNGEQDT